MSLIIQIGARSIMAATMKPIGLILNASIKAPWLNEIIALVEPQEGHGIFVIYFIKQTVKVFEALK